jgi:hypothetical protein
VPGGVEHRVAWIDVDIALALADGTMREYRTPRRPYRRIDHGVGRLTIPANLTRHPVLVAISATRGRLAPLIIGLLTPV